MKLRPTFALLAMLCIITPRAMASDSTTISPSRTYTTVRLTTPPPEIDGVLTDPCWQTGSWAGDYIQWIPREGARPSQPTYLKVLYDDHNIYVGIRAVDTIASEITARRGRRDQFLGDVVGINFDSYHDHRTGFEFNLTAAGQKIDLVLNNINWDVNWNAVWSGKTGFEDSAWTAEFRIPLSQLRYSADSVQVWGMHSWRWIDRFQEESDWEPQSSTGPGALYLFGELRGLAGLPAPQRIEVMPYVVTRLKTFPRDPRNPFTSSGREWFGGAGGDAKIGLSSNFTADLTINPDFGQVEADPSVMNLTAFETFYDERRPFFLEGRTIFNVDYDDGSLFYSRRIGRPPAFTPVTPQGVYVDMPGTTTIFSAVKVSGKTAGGLAVGVLQSLTAREYATIDSAGIRREEAVEPLTSYTYARVQQDFDNSATILGGAVGMVNRAINDPVLESLPRNALTGGLDLLHQWADKEYFLDVRLIGSAINGSAPAIAMLQRSSARYFQRPDPGAPGIDSTRTSLAGHGGSIRIGKGSKGLWRYATGLRWRSPGLEINDLGFMQQADVIVQGNSLSYFLNQPAGVFRTYTIKLNEANTWDFGGEYLFSDVSLDCEFQFLNQWGIEIEGEYKTAGLDTRLLRGGPAMRVPSTLSGEVIAHTDGSATVVGSMHAASSWTADGGGNAWSLEPLITVTPHQTLQISVGLELAGTTNDLQYVDVRYTDGKPAWILGRVDQRTVIATLRADYCITPELTIQYYGSPFSSVGRFSRYKNIAMPRAGRYDERYTPIPDPSTLPHPDFAFSQFRSNLVARWEFRPGSNVYLVWAQDRTAFETPGDPSAASTLWNLRNVAPENVVMLKFSYWLAL
jgi:hypothetical protein